MCSGDLRRGFHIAAWAEEEEEEEEEVEEEEEK